MDTQPIRFYHQGKLVCVSDAPPTRSVLDWLREDARRTGTKEGCNEGDCGACTVVIGELPQAIEPMPALVRGLSLRAVNACIRFLPTLHAKALFTVEDLKTIAGDRPHPVQRAMVDCHASQCGFCTPGFVMSLYAAYEQHQAAGTRPSRQELTDTLSGNLCRCTGYRPILDAGQRMFEPPAVALATAPVIAALRSLASEPGFHHAARNEWVAPPRTDHFHAPITLEALAALREQLPDALLLAGGTDIGVWVNKQHRDLGDLICIGNVPALKTIERRGDELHIGAAVSLEAAWRALAQRHPELTEVWRRFASVPIRHAGTLVGNLANGSPIGDAAPVLMALDAQLELRQGAQTRRLPLDRFYVDYQVNQLRRGEFVQAVIVPRAAPGLRLRAWKISKRFDSDISAVCAGLSVVLDCDNVVAQVRLAWGGMAGVVKRAAAAEAALLGQRWTQAGVDAAKAALTQDFTPLSDLRASAAYRLQVSQNLLQRFWLETRTEAPLSPQATRVWQVLPQANGPRGA